MTTATDQFGPCGQSAGPALDHDGREQYPSVSVPRGATARDRLDLDGGDPHGCVPRSAPVSTVRTLNDDGVTSERRETLGLQVLQRSGAEVAPGLSANERLDDRPPRRRPPVLGRLQLPEDVGQETIHVVLKGELTVVVPLLRCSPHKPPPQAREPIQRRRVLQTIREGAPRYSHGRDDARAPQLFDGRQMSHRPRLLLRIGLDATNVSRPRLTDVRHEYVELGAKFRPYRLGDDGGTLPLKSRTSVGTS
mmetsp:Transcript_18706/g.53979  ORF Transcript_18706/g.53979 Transcript_18706/m.53979 type:complete len:250 (-) Transcript_18706:2576-3325(-)